MAEESKGMGFKGVLLGMALGALSFFLVYQGACRAQASEGYSKAKPIAEWKAGSKEAFFVTGKIDPKRIGDKDFLNDDVPAMQLGRTVEVYAWQGEKKSSSGSDKKKDKDKKDKKKKDKDKKKKDKYKCEKGWTEKVKRDKEFERGCEGKPFTAKKIDSKKEKNAVVTIQSGDTQYTVGDATFVDTLSITSENIAKHVKADAPIVKKGDYFYDKATCGGDKIDTKMIGCHRIKFIGVLADQSDYTVLGGEVKEGVDSKGKGRIEGLAPFQPQICKGTKESCLKGISKKDSRSTWLFWIGSVLAMFFSMVLVTGPLTNLIEKIPLIGGFGSGLLKFVMFIFSFILMTAVFFLVKWWFVWVGLAVGGIILLVVMRKK